MNTPSEAIILRPGEGESFQLKAGPFTIKADSEETDGAVGVWEDTVLPKAGPPLHIHHECAEFFYVQEGRFIFQIGDSQSNVSAGSFVFVPKGMAHTFQNIGTEVGKYWGFAVPAGLEQFLKEQAQTPPEQMTPEKYREIAARHDFDIVGPQLGGE